MNENISIVRSQRFELVGCACEWEFRKRCCVLRKQFCKFRLGVETGADGGSTLRQRIQILDGRAKPRDAALNLRRISGEFLPERQRRRILGVRPSNLDDIERTPSLSCATP